MRVYDVTVTEGDPLGMPPEGSPEWVLVKVRSLRAHAAQSQYDAERAARSGRWLRDHPESWGEHATWEGFTQSVCEVSASWVDFLIENEPAISGKAWSDARRDYAAAVEEIPAARGRGRPKGSEDLMGDSPIKSGGNSNRADRVIARLKRERAKGDALAGEQLGRIASGEASPSAVALDRGWRKARWSAPVDVDGLAAALLRRLSPDDISRLADLIAAGVA